MRIGGIVLAGDGEGKALWVLASRPLFSWVVEALSSSQILQQLVVVGPEGVKSHLPPGVKWAPPGAGTAESAFSGLKALEGDLPWILLVTGDIPFLTPEGVRDFLERCREREGEVYYPIIERERVEACFPGARRTYVPLKEGVFTGGNILLIKRDVFLRHFPWVQKLVALRKKPFGLAQLLGWEILSKFLLHRLSIGDIEKRVEQLTGIKGVAVITPYAEIGMDVDKESHMHLARKLLEGEGEKDGDSGRDIGGRSG
ncbi:MAG TPA: hypothetical protein ENM97_02775 [Moorella mulderi]|nr:hypothetical protein [Moorella mulderi]